MTHATYFGLQQGVAKSHQPVEKLTAPARFRTERATQDDHANAASRIDIQVSPELILEHSRRSDGLNAII
jgi:hypothetical protein